MARLMDRLASETLDDGTDHFDASTLAVTTIDTGNPANNVIPATCRATVNIRFNDAHSSDSLTTWLKDEAARVSTETGVEIALRTQVSGESFLTPPGALSDLVGRAVEAETGIQPESFDLGWHVRCAVHQGALSGRRVRIGRPDDASGGRAGRGGPDHVLGGHLSPHP